MQAATKELPMRKIAEAIDTCFADRQVWTPHAESMRCTK